MVAGNFKIGQIVRSKAGRDKDRYFIVLDIGKDVVYLADGDIRRVESPKKKNKKHIQATNYISTELLNDLEEGRIPSNKILRRVLKEKGFCSNFSKGG